MDRTKSQGTISFDQTQSILGLDTNPKVQAAWRMGRGITPSHEQIQYVAGCFAAWLQCEDALIVPKPFPAHRLAVISLADGESALIYDERSPSRFITASRMLVERGALQYSFSHQEPEALANVFRLVPPTRQSLVLTRSVSTHTGRRTPIATCYSLCRAHAARLVVEDTITLGLRGIDGRSVFSDVPYSEDGLVVVADLEPTFAWPGVLIAGQRNALLLIRERLLVTSQLHWQPLEPLSIALGIVDSPSGNHLRLHLARLGQHLVYGARRLGLAMHGTGPFIVLGSMDSAMADYVIKAFASWGIQVNATRTSIGMVALTFVITVNHTEDQMDRLLHALARVRNRLIPSKTATHRAA